VIQLGGRRVWSYSESLLPSPPLDGIGLEDLARNPLRAKSENNVMAGNFCVRESSANKFVLAPINGEDSIKTAPAARREAEGNAASRSARLRTSSTPSLRWSIPAAAWIPVNWVLVVVGACEASSQAASLVQHDWGPCRRRSARPVLQNIDETSSGMCIIQTTPSLCGDELR
jgi:hypothetical protein